jgi:hypothetical protein
MTAGSPQRRPRSPAKQRRAELRARLAEQDALVDRNDRRRAEMPPHERAADILLWPLNDVVSPHATAAQVLGRLVNHDRLERIWDAMRPAEQDMLASSARIAGPGDLVTWIRSMGAAQRQELARLLAAWGPCLAPADAHPDPDRIPALIEQARQLVAATLRARIIGAEAAAQAAAGELADAREELARQQAGIPEAERGADIATWALAASLPAAATVAEAAALLNSPGRIAVIYHYMTHAERSVLAEAGITCDQDLADWVADDPGDPLGATQLAETLAALADDIRTQPREPRGHVPG